MPRLVVPSDESSILESIASARRLAPEAAPPDLPADRAILGMPTWHSFEREAWALGEAVRQALAANVRLRQSASIQAALVSIIEYKQLRRGRQSFFFSLGHVGAAANAGRVAALLADHDVQGHALDALLKMKASAYRWEVGGLSQSPQAWIRKLAKRYLDRYARVA